MNDTTTATEEKTRTYFIEAKAGGSPRLIRARSAAAVREYLVLEQWTEPRRAKMEDVERAMAHGCSSIEKA
jgi:hypothetical protein